MNVNKIPFVITTSRAVHFGTVEIIKEKECNHIDKIK